MKYLCTKGHINPTQIAAANCGTCRRAERRAAQQCQAEKPLPLTPTQADCLCVIQEYQDAYAYAPTLEELCLELQIASKSGVSALLGLLERKGWIARDRVNGHARPRGIQLLYRLPPEPDPETIEVSAAGKAYVGRAA